MMRAVTAIAAALTFGLSIGVLAVLGAPGPPGDSPSSQHLSAGAARIEQVLRSSWPPLVRQAYAADDACFVHTTDTEPRQATLRTGGPGLRCVVLYRRQLATMGQLSDALTSESLEGPLSSAVVYLRATLSANLERDQPLLEAMLHRGAGGVQRLLDQPLPPPICIAAVNEAIEPPDSVPEATESLADDPLVRFPYTNC
jgi:hypothetical protein